MTDNTPPFFVKGTITQAQMDEASYRLSVERYGKEMADQLHPMSDNTPTREMPHVYQNRKDWYDVDKMHFCPVCNGFYGVPHDGCAEWRGCRGSQFQCACRKHTEMRGSKREGTHGWITG